MQTLRNGILTIDVNDHGAELRSIVKNGTEYLWQADPTYWNRQSPILFPIVGSVWNGTFRAGGKEYAMGQHGFARDMEFILASRTEDSVTYRLDSDESTLAHYPWPFRLEIGYRLRGNEIIVIWKVENTGTEKMYFQIGAHPAFNYPDYGTGSKGRGFFSFDRTEGLECVPCGEKGCVAPGKYALEIPEDGFMPLDANTFDEVDTFVLQDSQLKKVTLYRNDRTPWVGVEFDAPVVGLWSPPHKDAPFVCIEPWYGRCDRMNYVGEFKDRDWVNALAPGAVFNASYTIRIY